MIGVLTPCIWCPDHYISHMDRSRKFHDLGARDQEAKIVRFPPLFLHSSNLLLCAHNLWIEQTTLQLYAQTYKAARPADQPALLRRGKRLDNIVEPALRPRIPTPPPPVVVDRYRPSLLTGKSSSRVFNRVGTRTDLFPCPLIFKTAILEDSLPPAQSVHSSPAPSMSEPINPAMLPTRNSKRRSTSIYATPARYSPPPMPYNPLAGHSSIDSIPEQQQLALPPLPLPAEALPAMPDLPPVPALSDSNHAMEEDGDPNDEDYSPAKLIDSEQNLLVTGKRVRKPRAPPELIINNPKQLQATKKRRVGSYVPYDMGESPLVGTSESAAETNGFAATQGLPPLPLPPSTSTALPDLPIDSGSLPLLPPNGAGALPPLENSSPRRVEVPSEPKPRSDSAPSTAHQSPIAKSSSPAKEEQAVETAPAQPIESAPAASPAKEPSAPDFSTVSATDEPMDALSAVAAAIAAADHSRKQANQGGASSQPQEPIQSSKVPETSSTKAAVPVEVPAPRAPAQANPPSDPVEVNKRLNNSIQASSQAARDSSPGGGSTAAADESTEDSNRPVRRSARPKRFSTPLGGSPGVGSPGFGFPPLGGYPSYPAAAPPPPQNPSFRPPPMQARASSSRLTLDHQPIPDFNQHLIDPNLAPTIQAAQGVQQHQQQQQQNASAPSTPGQAPAAAPYGGLPLLPSFARHLQAQRTGGAEEGGGGASYNPMVDYMRAHESAQRPPAQPFDAADDSDASGQQSASNTNGINNGDILPDFLLNSTKRKRRRYPRGWQNPSDAMICANCSTDKSPLWRRNAQGSYECNACCKSSRPFSISFFPYSPSFSCLGLYFKSHGHHRPPKVVDRGIGEARMTKRRIEASGGSGDKHYKRPRPSGTPLPLQQPPGPSPLQQPTFSYGEMFQHSPAQMPSSSGMGFPALPVLPVLPALPPGGSARGGGLNGTLSGGLSGANGYQSPYFNAAESYSNPHPLAYSHAPLASTSSASAYDPFGLPSPTRLDHNGANGATGSSSNSNGGDEQRRMLETLAAQALSFGPSDDEPMSRQGGNHQQHQGGASSSSASNMPRSNISPLPHRALTGLQEDPERFQPSPPPSATAMPLQPLPFS